MKTTISLKRAETFASTLFLTLFLACGPSKNTSAQTQSPPTAPSTPPTAAAAGMIRYEAQPSGSKMTINGSSSPLGGWKMESVLIGGYLEADPKFPESALTDVKAAKPVVNVFMPVSTFKSGKAAMDGRMQKEMKATQFKRIEYKLIELKPTSAAGATGALKFDAIGTLTIVGKTRTNSMPVTIEKLKDGKLKVTGSTPLKMTDYGIEPPTTALLFQSADDVTLTFEWLAAPKAP